MRECTDFPGIDASLFSTSDPGGAAPEFGQTGKALFDAFDQDQLTDFDILLTCQGGDYTQRIYPEGLERLWIDAASTLRMADSAMLVLDPVKRKRDPARVSMAALKPFAGPICYRELDAGGAGRTFPNWLHRVG